MCFLRASGGVSSPCHYKRPCNQFSPRKRRCFFKAVRWRMVGRVFSAQAEVFLTRKFSGYVPTCFLRASGGVSDWTTAHPNLAPFSPRKRRCFSTQQLPGAPALVFSAQAEVFLLTWYLRTNAGGFLRASGGVSSEPWLHSVHFRFSPRKRRCFLWLSVRNVSVLVFSAPAEVFLLFLCAVSVVFSFLRASGGVSRQPK